jgi:hypothetical protein
MKVLFYTVFMATPHFETELELIQEHILKGDEVYILHCKGQLRTCFLNPTHNLGYCIICQSKFKSGISLINTEKVKFIELPTSEKQYPGIPPVFKSIDELKEFKIGNVEVGMATASSLITSFNREHRLNTVKYRKLVFTEVNNAYFVYLFFKKNLVGIQPEMVYLFNGRFSTILPAINACEEMGIRYATHERGGVNNKYYLAFNTTPHDLENAHNEIEQLWENTDENVRLEIGKKFFNDRRNRVEHAWFSFTKSQESGLLPKNFDTQKKNIGLFNTTIEEYAAIRNWKKPIPIYKEESIAFNKIFESLNNDSTIQIYLRVHPNLKGADNSQMQDIKSLEGKFKNVTILFPESNVDSYTLMENCDTIITFGSTIGVEACYWNKPSILLGMSYYDKLDCCYIPQSHEETIELIRTDLMPKPKIGALKYGFWELSKGIDFKFFKQTGLASGQFLGKEVNFTTGSFIKSVFAYIISIRSIYDVKQFYKIVKKILFKK